MKYGPLFSFLKAGGRKLLILHREASVEARSMPASVMNRLAQAILAYTNYTILTVAPVDLRDERVVDLTGVMDTFEAYMYCISQADGFVSVDTSLSHIADAFNVPGVALFTVEAVARWVSYYPLVEGLQVSQPTGALDMDLNAIARDWDRVDADEVLARLERAVDRRIMFSGEC